MSQSLDFNAFKELANAEGLSGHERSGFPDYMREGYSRFLLEDVLSKLVRLASNEPLKVLDLGCGCNSFTDLFVQNSINNGHNLYLVDSVEVLSRTDTPRSVNKVAGRFPQDLGSFIKEEVGSFDVILCYSVIQYPTLENSLIEFLFGIDSLLTQGGSVLFGDIPNEQKRNEYFLSKVGKEEHQRYLKKNSLPSETLVGKAVDNIQESDVAKVIAFFDQKGYHVDRLDLSNQLANYGKREDLLFQKS